MVCYFLVIVEDYLQFYAMYYKLLKGLILNYYFNESNFSPLIYGASLQRPRFVPVLLHKWLDRRNSTLKIHLHIIMTSYCLASWRSTRCILSQKDDALMDAIILPMGIKRSMPEMIVYFSAYTPTSMAVEWESKSLHHRTVVKVSFHLLEEFLEKHATETKCINGNSISSFKGNALFQDYHGLLSFSFKGMVVSDRAQILYNHFRILHHGLLSFHHGSFGRTITTEH